MSGSRTHARLLKRRTLPSAQSVRFHVRDARFFRDGVAHVYITRMATAYENLLVSSSSGCRCRTSTVRPRRTPWAGTAALRSIGHEKTSRGYGNEELVWIDNRARPRSRRRAFEVDRREDRCPRAWRFRRACRRALRPVCRGAIVSRSDSSDQRRVREGRARPRCYRAARGGSSTKRVSPAERSSM